MQTFEMDIFRSINMQVYEILSHAKQQIPRNYHIFSSHVTALQLAIQYELNRNSMPYNWIHSQNMSTQSNSFECLSNS